MPDDVQPSPCAQVSLSEDEGIRRGKLLHAAGSVANADIYLIEQGATTVVLKTFRRRPWLVRVLFSRWTLAHEVAVLEALGGVSGVPRFCGRVGKDSFLMEYVCGAGPVLSPRELPVGHYPSREFFVRLRELVAGMHARGVSHGDMRRRNILRGEDDRPYLIDFATSVIAGGRWHPVRRWLVAWFAQADAYAVAKLMNSYYPDLLTDDERRCLERLPWHLRLGRFLRKRVYRRFIKQKHWRERWDRFRRRGPASGQS